MRSSLRSGYAALLQDEEKDTDSQDHGSQHQRHWNQCSQCTRYVQPSPQHRIVALSGWMVSVMLAMLLLMQSWRPAATDLAQCVRETSTWSPLLEDHDVSITEHRFNGTLDWPSPYRGLPSPAVDAAWERISMVRPLDLPFSRADLVKLGTNPDTAATNAPEHGGGYLLMPEFSHQLHCVNLLRKASYFKFPYYKRTEPGFIDDPDMFKVHLDHCVEILRQFLMCHADLGVVSSHWIQGRSTPWPDFNTKHVCRDFEGVLEWTQQHQLPEGTPMVPLKPAGVQELSTPP